MGNLFKLIKRNIFFFIIIASLAIIGLAIIADPFSIPFQDFENMPAQQKQWYIQQSELCTVLKYIGVSGLIVGISGIAYYYLTKPKRSVKSKEQ
jgi:hypothetical protein